MNDDNIPTTSGLHGECTRNSTETLYREYGACFRGYVRVCAVCCM